MSEILENQTSDTGSQKVDTQEVVAAIDENVSNDEASEEVSAKNDNQVVVNEADVNEETSVEKEDAPVLENYVSDEQAQEFVEFLQKVISKKQEAIKEINDKREYLISNLVNYDTEDYFENDCFKELYTSVFNKIGTNLDTEKFINLVDKYVLSRIESNSRKKLAKRENENLTEKFKFNSGLSKKADRKLRMQDIPENELERYIAKYI